MKDKNTLITIIILLIIMLPLGILGTIEHFQGPKKIDESLNNPNKEFILNNKVYFFVGEKLISTYECNNCAIADTVIDDNQYHTNSYKNGNKILDTPINEYFSIFKKDNSYILYNIVGKSIVDEYEEIKNYNVDAVSNFIINHKKSGWGITFFEIGKTAIQSTYDYIAIPSHFIGQKLDTSKFIVKQNNLWFILKDDGTPLINAIASEIVDFNDNYYITYDNNTYHIFDYNGIEYLSAIPKTNVYGVGDYLFIINDKQLFIYKDAKGSIVKFVTLPDYKDLYFSLEEKGINIIIDGNITETLELS